LPNKKKVSKKKGPCFGQKYRDLGVNKSEGKRKKKEENKNSLKTLREEPEPKVETLGFITRRG